MQSLYSKVVIQDPTTLARDKCVYAQCRQQAAYTGSSLPIKSTSFLHHA